MGNLRNRSNAGLFYVNCRNRVGNGRWNYASRDYAKKSYISIGNR